MKQSYVFLYSGKNVSGMPQRVEGTLATKYLRAFYLLLLVVVVVVVVVVVTMLY